ncbi:MAG: UDP-N-acetylmuramoyl-L-alanyl-D-glutamate--2,6-diaminopimelate ligase [Limnochordaceae bacterium]|nr:UDP-N-acetylmuramoyl-L-alanyl-D-glutamate--2,6-diaminopimelate ligase [Limnochordaceae bacterium]
MRWHELLAVLPATRLVGAGGDPEVQELTYDSRMARPGSVFVAIRGFNVDGHAYAEEAVAKGAVALVVERPLPGLEVTVPQAVVQDTRAALADLSVRFYGNPAAKLRLIGVTGTKGKTSTTYLVKAILEAVGQKVGLIGTIQNLIGSEPLPTHRTTPESLDLQELFAQMRQAAVQSVVMEVSSHALVLQRVRGCRFSVAVFTNISRDHLDFHRTFEEYLDAKAGLFRLLAQEGKGPRPGEPPAMVVNRDDAHWTTIARAGEGSRLITFGVESEEADIRATDVHTSLAGTTFTVHTRTEQFPLRLHLVGVFNVYNGLAALGVAQALGLDLRTAGQALAGVLGVPGRFERIEQGQPFLVVVDYAHSPDSLERVLQAASDLKPRALRVVFGCGGDRDRGKRPLMGAIAARQADDVIITSDNPRSEEPESICRAIEEGFLQVPQPRARSYQVIVDRRQAIRYALARAGPGDLVLIAGKGHEDYQEVAGGRIHFDDREVARQLLGELGYRGESARR